MISCCSTVLFVIIPLCFQVNNGKLHSITFNSLRYCWVSVLFPWYVLPPGAVRWHAQWAVIVLIVVVIFTASNRVVNWTWDLGMSRRDGYVLIRGVTIMSALLLQWLRYGWLGMDTVTASPGNVFIVLTRSALRHHLITDRSLIHYDIKTKQRVPWSAGNHPRWRSNWWPVICTPVSVDRLCPPCG
jgi:hypothetical protein